MILRNIGGYLRNIPEDLNLQRYSVVQLVEALRYKPEGGGLIS
jgi:hypothetical protein